MKMRNATQRYIYLGVSIESYEEEINLSILIDKKNGAIIRLHLIPCLNAKYRLNSIENAELFYGSSY